MTLAPKPPKLPHGRRHDELFNPRKLFVGGVSKAVGQEEFREFWKQFGELEDCVVMVVGALSLSPLSPIALPAKSQFIPFTLSLCCFCIQDPQTQHSRGFGFVVFASQTTVCCTAIPRHYLFLALCLHCIL